MTQTIEALEAVLKSLTETHEANKKEAESIKENAAKLKLRREALAKAKEGLTEKIKEARKTLKEAKEKAEKEAEAKAKAQKEAEKAAERAKAKAQKEAEKKAKSSKTQGQSKPFGSATMHTEVMADLARNYGLRSNMDDKHYNEVKRKYTLKNHQDLFANDGKSKIDRQTALCQWMESIVETLRKQSGNTRKKAA